MSIGAIARAAPGAVMSGLLFGMLYLPLVLAAVILITGVIGIFIPIAPVVPQLQYHGDAPMVP